MGSTSAPITHNNHLNYFVQVESQFVLTISLGTCLLDLVKGTCSYKYRDYPQRSREMITIALVGVGRIGTHHARTIAAEISGAELRVLSDPLSPNLTTLAEELNVPTTYRDPLDIAKDESIDAVVIAAPAATHPELIDAFAKAGKHIFTEKPVALTVKEAREASEAASDAGVVFQVGFNRRFADSWAEAKNLIDSGAVGSLQRIHSITRDPGPFSADPARIPLNTIFNETLIHDFDTINWLNEGSEPVEVYTMADALVRPDARDAGFLDSAVVSIRYANGVLATAEACFCAMYGYDLRGEAFGSNGMVQMGRVASSDTHLFDASGEVVETRGTDTSRFHDAYRKEFQAFVDRVAGKDVSGPDGAAGVRAQLVAAAAILSFEEKRPVAIEEVSK